MQTVTSNTTQQINSALFALDKSIKELNTAINVIEKALKENDATLLEKINEKVNKADVVDAVTDGDLNPVTSNAVYDGLSEKVNTSDVVDRIEVNNSNPVTSNAVAMKLEWIELPANAQIPDCHEINITCFVTLGNTEIVYSNQFSTENISGIQSLFIGGYYYNGTDFGLCNVNAVNRVISKRNFVYGGVDYLSQSSVKVRYR